ncbi:MAG TPA: hypothetical protein VL688_11380 [Verrucomicrobiae bacterium]|jgi:hypothetical protein|nr:hypothetical protein [Verrucomicrobiae bacterium]
MLRDARGSILFETFVALMVLSVGVTGSLRLFGQALQASDRNRQQAESKQFLDELLFSVFAGIDEGVVPEHGEEKATDLGEDGLKARVRLVPLGVEKTKAQEVPKGGHGEYGRLVMNVENGSGQKVFQAETVIRQQSAAK